MNDFHSHSRWRFIGVLCAVAFCCLGLFTADALAASGNVGENVANLLKGYAADLYGGVVAIFSLVFLWNRRYIELATFLLAAIVVAWMVFAPETIGKAAQAIAQQIFG